MQNQTKLAETLQDSANWYVASLVVHANPEKLTQVKTAIQALPYTEIHAQADDAKLVVIVEADVERELVEKMETVERLDGVAAVSLIYSQRDEQ